MFGSAAGRIVSFFSQEAHVAAQTAYTPVWFAATGRQGGWADCVSLCCGRGHVGQLFWRHGTDRSCAHVAADSACLLVLDDATLACVPMCLVYCSFDLSFTRLPHREPGRCVIMPRRHLQRTHAAVWKPCYRQRHMQGRNRPAHPARPKFAAIGVSRFKRRCFAHPAHPQAVASAAGSSLMHECLAHMLRPQHAASVAGSSMMRR